MAINAAPLAQFHPAVAAWFRQRFAELSPVQAAAWPVIRQGENTLLLAPTGSGKTLAAFLCAIDRLVAIGYARELPAVVQVLYISPLKALGNDIRKNLAEPLAGIRAIAGETFPDIRVAVRTGDTPANERARMVKQPPHILITTPESLYIMLGSKGMGEALRSVSTVIVDEVHAMCGNKRGTHLAVSLERLAEVVGQPLQRIACSATLNPLEEIAAFVVGNDPSGQPRPCTIIDAGTRKNLDVQVVSPLPDFLEASNTALWSSAYEYLIDQIHRHHTTLVFANSRYKVERTALRLAELAGSELTVSAHHGSMARETRLAAEEALKAGRLDAIIATSALELGIDIGSVDLVCQLESPRTIAAGMQRVGRAGHLLDATSKGRIMVFERDELLEAAEICRNMAAGAVDAVRIPLNCLDVLAQQIAGAVAARPRQVGELFRMLRQAYPYRTLSRAQFDAVLAMLAGEHPFEMARPPQPLLLWDRTADRLTATRNAAHVCAMCAGTINETSDYEVVIDGTNKRVGTVQAEFADDNLRRGDVFVLGSTAWRMVGVRRNRLLVTEAPGATPTVPWWLGDVESRSVEVGVGIGKLRREVASRLDSPDLLPWLQREYRLSPDASVAVAGYIREQQLAAGIVPDETVLLVESWRDELGRANVIVHSPYGTRLNRTWGVVLANLARERHREDWSVTATNDILLLTRREPQVPALDPSSATGLMAELAAADLTELAQSNAREDAGFGTRFREAAVCSFQILRAWQGKRVAPWLQNLRAEELMTAAAAHPDYVVTAEVIRTYLQDTLDVPGLQRLIHRIEAGEVRLAYRDVASPSPFAHGILLYQIYRSDSYQMGRDRRAHLLRLHRKALEEVLSSGQLAELLDVRASRRLEERLRHWGQYQATNSDELAAILRELGDVPATAEALAAVAGSKALSLLAELIQARRVVAVRLPHCEQEPERLVVPEAWARYRSAFADGSRFPLFLPYLTEEQGIAFTPARVAECIPARYRAGSGPSATRKEVIERFLRCHGLVTIYEIMNHTGWPYGAVEGMLQELQAEGKVASGVYTREKPAPQWANRVNLEEIHRLTMEYLKQELAACAPPETVDFTMRWQHLHPACRVSGLAGLREVIRQLQGYEVPQGVLETYVLPCRIADYEPGMLDQLFAGGEVCWRRVGTQSIRRGMLTLCLRSDAPWLSAGAPLRFDVEKEADVDIAADIVAVRNFFRSYGAAFFGDVLTATGVSEEAAWRAVWHLAWCGELSCDTYAGLRYANFHATLSACYDLMHTPGDIVRGKDSMARVIDRMQRRGLNPRVGRWWPTERLRSPLQPLPEIDIGRRWARQLLTRWGIVSRDLVQAESAAPAWAALQLEFKRLELLGEVQRGYFVAGYQGEQYGLPEAVEMLRDCKARRSEICAGYIPGEPVFAVSYHDPAYLYGTCLDILNTHGEKLPPSHRIGANTARAAMQAGQPLLLAHGQLLAALTPAQLGECLRVLQYDAAGDIAPTVLRRWNGYTVDTHPVTSLLCAAGFGLSADGMEWPPRQAKAEPLSIATADVYLPYDSDPPPVQFGPEWIVQRAPGHLQELVTCILDMIQVELAGRAGWQVRWNAGALDARYQDISCLRFSVRSSFVEATIRPPWFTDFRATYKFQGWGRVYNPADVDEAYIADFRARRDAAEASLNRWLVRRHRDTGVAQVAEKSRS